MIYGVKVILTHSVGEDDRRYYEEMILRVVADSFDGAYEKAAAYVQDYESEYRNPDDELVKLIRIELADAFLAFEEEGDVQELYSGFQRNITPLSEEDYYAQMVATCGEQELLALRNKAFN